MVCQELPEPPEVIAGIGEQQVLIKREKQKAPELNILTQGHREKK